MNLQITDTSQFRIKGNSYNRDSRYPYVPKAGNKMPKTGAYLCRTKLRQD